MRSIEHTIWFPILRHVIPFNIPNIQILKLQHPCNFWFVGELLSFRKVERTVQIRRWLEQEKSSIVSSLIIFRLFNSSRYFS